MRIAIIVHGRFHAFDLARELIRLGADVYVLTNYPKSIAEKFGIPPERVRSNLLHGILSRALQKIGDLADQNIFEAYIHQSFSRWAADILNQENFDVVHGFSGVCEEVFRSKPRNRVVRMLVRGSAHIEEQYEILLEEQRRTGHRAYLPSFWMRQREIREYQLADCIIVLSKYAYDSFVRQGVSHAKLRLLRLGTQHSVFRPNATTISERCQRIRNNEKLRVLTIGTFSLRKGGFDFVEIARRTCEIATFRFVGAVLPRATKLAQEASKYIKFVPKVTQFELPPHYNWGDVFLFPTLEDGYAVVLAQALAAGLPILSTVNCAAPDLVTYDATGWVFPIRQPELFTEKIQWCNEHRRELAEMAQQTYTHYAPRDWSDVARDFLDICIRAKREKQQREAHAARV
jgi:glycosyltransferase involved in cell wall biosynthesis